MQNFKLQRLTEWIYQQQQLQLQQQLLLLHSHFEDHYFTFTSVTWLPLQSGKSTFCRQDVFISVNVLKDSITTITADISCFTNSIIFSCIIILHCNSANVTFHKVQDCIHKLHLLNDHWCTSTVYEKHLHYFLTAKELEVITSLAVQHNEVWHLLWASLSICLPVTLVSHA